MRRLWTGRGLVATAVVVIVAVTGGVVYARRGTSAVQYRTAAATMGTVTQTITLTGNLTPSSETDLDFESSGRVNALPVLAGEAIKQGTVVATLDTITLRSALTTAQASLQAAQARLSLDQAGPTAQMLAQTQGSVSSSRVSLQNSETSLADTQTSNAQSISQASSAVSAAQAGVAADQQTLSADGAKTLSDEHAQSADCVIQPPTQQCQADNQAVAADNQRTAADNQTLTRDQGALSGAENALAATQVKAQQSFDQAQGQVNTAEVSLRNALAALAALQQGSTSQQIAMDQSQVTIAQVGVDTASRNLTLATLVAPVDGVVGALNLTIGQSVTGTGGSSATSGTAASSTSSSTHQVVLLTPGAFEVTGTVTDSQINQIAVGQRARVTVAGSTEAVTGKVSAVSPEATITSGVATFSVTVTIDGSNPSLHAGSSASISVIVNQVVQVLTVPSSAVQVTAAGATVQVLVDGEPQSRSIQVGAIDPLRSQIVSGLSPGDSVVIATVTGTVPTTGAAGGGGLLNLGGGRAGRGGPGG